ncbi:hypothetical protein [Colwellia echini]|uniref:STAS/SEC14 domain-containing protein n=1 Tax=Colwellia echini TaxID=1982103 RepID=A0ABY3N1S4_9GAMM|nr:hypothetical protein [Colwellia echini]TYK67349.1 hypothetical protein CWS31_002165 [Colwellia echini]
MKQSVQGCYVIEQQENIMLVDVQGAFDEETAESFHKDIQQLTEKMSGSAWGSLVTFRGNGLITPEAESQLRETTQHRQRKGMIAIAVVILNSSNADIQQMQFQRIYQDCELQFHVFTDSENASNWLNDFVEQESAYQSA